MIHPTATILDRFFRTFTTSSHPLLLLDYDGTLAPFHVDRFQAVPWPGVRAILNRIQAQKRTRLVVVSGRPSAEVAPLLALSEPVEIWGLHGFEHLRADGSHEFETLPAPIQQKLDEIHAALSRDSFGGLFESKPNAAVMHWRGVPPDQAAIIRQRTRELFEPAAKLEGFCLLPFEAGLELRAGRDKGGAVQTILAESPEHTPVAYLGDDYTDETAFRVLKGRGLSVLVRPEQRETEADLWLKPPEELMEFLETWHNAESGTL